MIDKPLVSQAIWQEVNDRLATKAKGRKDSLRPPPTYPLGGLLRCSCGLFFDHRATSHATGHDAYRCASRRKGGPGCGMPRVRREVVEAAVIRMIRAKFRNPYLLITLTDAIERRARKAPARDQHAAKERSRLEKRRESILESKHDGHLTREQCNERIAAVDRELAALRIEAASRAPDGYRQGVAAALQKHFSGFETWDLERQRRKLLLWTIERYRTEPEGDRHDHLERRISCGSGADGNQYPRCGRSS